MNARERFLAVARFGKPDMVPLMVSGPRKLTLERWYSEGLPKDIDVSVYFKFDKSDSICGSPGVNLGPSPAFEYEIIEKTDRYWVFIDSLGIKQRGFKHDWEDGWSGFATRQFLEFPVRDRSSFLEIKKRYEPHASERYPKNWDEMAERWSRRDYPLSVSISGPFWWTRNMMGLEKMVLAMYKDPGLICEIMDFCAEFHTTTLEKALNEVDVDWAMISEDMAYKKGPMISPHAFREFMFKPYREICSFLKEHGIDVIMIDSDGNPGLLIPVWLEAGVNGISPCEIAANMDLIKLRENYPRLILMGGIDKRELARDKQSIEREVLSKVPHLIKNGGYFPGVDHAVPPDISLENYKHFLNFSRKICGWPQECMIP